MKPTQTNYLVLPALMAMVIGTLSPSCAAKPPLESQPVNAEYRLESPPSTPAAIENMTDHQKYLTIGRWGAMGISFVVSANSVSVELNTANAVINQRPKLNKNGEFDVIGRYHREGPGANYEHPAQPDQPGASTKGASDQEARFRGKVSGKKISLTISVAKTGETLGTYTLEFGKSGTILKPM